MLAAVAVACLLAGCSQPPDRLPQERVRDTVIRYNRLLGEGYRSMDMSRMRQVARELQSEDEYIHMSSLGEGGVRLLPYLKHFEFTSVSVDETTALAQTRETWDFVHESPSTREVILVQEDMTYDVAWDLEADPDGRWYVTDSRVLEATSVVAPKTFGVPAPGLGHF